MVSNEEQTCIIPGFPRISDLILITVCGIGLLICPTWANGWPSLHTTIFGISCYNIGFLANGYLQYRAAMDETDVQETLTEDMAEPDRVIETEIPEDVEEVPSQILETHGVTTLVHEMKVDGFHLVERKQKINVDPMALDNTPKMTIINHSRSIDDRCYDVQKILTEGMAELDQVIETEMTQEEVEKFEEDWKNLWNPDNSHFD